MTPEFTARKSPPKPQGHLPRFIPARAIALPLAALLLTSCASAPPWYTIGDTPADILHGLGQGETREQAKARALSSLAEQLKVSIRSETRLTTKGDAESSSLSVEHEVETRTNILIRGAEILREEKRNGRWYLLCRYDSHPSRVRVHEKLPSE